MKTLGRFSAERQKLLRQVLAERGVRAPGRDSIPRRAETGPPALSFAQQRLWVLDRLEPGSAFYNIPLAVRLAGRLSLSALFGALMEVVRRHEALRTTFGEVEGRPFQVIAAEPDPELGTADLSCLPEEARSAEIARLAAQEAARPFDLERGPLVRTVVLRLAPDEHVAIVTMHHIVSDGWSFGVFLRETAALYEAALRGLPPPLPPLPVQYADFAAWQRSWLSGPVLDEQLGWWRGQLAGAPAALDLPVDRPRPASPSFRGTRRPVLLKPDLADRLRDLCRREDATLFMALLAAFATVLGRAAGQTDLVIGTPIANRNREEIEGLIGFFVNTLALRVRLDGATGFRALLAQVRATAHGAYGHQDLPFERLVEELAPEREAGRNPLFQVMFALQNTPVPTLEVPDLALVPLPTETGTAKFDLSLFLQESGDWIGGDLEYSTELLDAPTALRLIARLELFLEAALADPEAPVAELPLLPEAERHQILIEWNDTEPEPADAALLHELFEAQAARTPDDVALIAGEERWTYRELNERADEISAELRALGVGPEDRVAISMPRTPWMIAGMFGILKAGGAYVPVDPTYPDARREQILEDAQPRAILDLKTGRRGIQNRKSKIQNLAYLIYTSGSTGAPKGVAIPHATAVAMVRWALEVFSAKELWRVLAATSINFDLSVFEIFVPLSAGGAVVLAEDALAFPRLPAAGEVTLVNTVPSAMTELVRAGAVPPSVRTVNLAGEPLPRDLVDALYRIPTVRRVYDLYGPSEDTTYSTFARMEREDRRAPSIGRPVAGTRVQLLDRAFQAVPIGVPGELCLGGAGLARGYLGRPALTAECWVPDPSGRLGQRLYRTGDLARFRTDGTLEFLGRIDHQVKVRGFRIELGEIEETLRSLPGVREAAVLALGEGAERRLAAFVACVGLETTGLREALRERLPAHMVPTSFAFLDALPLTPNGKVDRRALSRVGTKEARTAESFVAPRGPVEELVAEIFAEVLGGGWGGERIGATQHFFELGGHSLLAMRALSRVRTALGADLPLRALFEAPTVEALARRIEEARRTGDGQEAPPLVPVPRDRDLPLSFAQERMWFMDRLAPGSLIYNVPEVMRLRGPLRPEVLARCLDEMVARHESLRTRFGVSRDGRPVQIIDPELHLPLYLIDLSALPEAARLQETERVAWSEVRRPFDLTRGPVVRGGLVRLAPEDHVTLLSRHHIVSDGWSMDLFSWEVSVLYQAFAAGRPSPLPPLPIQYADFAVWQRELLRGELLERQLGYWRQRLAGAPPLLELPTDRPRPPIQTHRGEIRTLHLPEERVQALHALARRDSSTLFMILLTAFETWIHRVTGRDDILVGTPVANRHRPELETLIGFLANTLVLRTDLSGDPPFREALARVRDTALGAYENQDVPFERVVEELRPRRDLSYTPIFQVMYVQQAIPRELPDQTGSLADGGKVEGVEALARFDFELYAIETFHGVELAAEYNVDLFDRVRVDRTLSHLEALLDAVLADPEQPLSGFPFLTTPERRQLATAPEAEKPAWELPRGPVERLVADLWAEALGEVLGERVIGAHDDFFDLGGHSLLATRYVTRLRDEVGIDLPVRAVFEAPTVAGQARKVVAGKLSLSGAIIPRETGGDAPLTFAQERMWFLERLEPGAAYHIPLAVRLTGSLDSTALETALTTVVLRHEALRTTFPSLGGRPVQRIAADPAILLPRIDLTGLSSSLRETELPCLGAEMAARLFDLEHGPLLRALLVAVGPEEHVLLASVHHIVFDGWSIGILLREVAVLYRAADLPALPIQYADWTVWQRRWMESGALDEGLAWWRGHLGSEPPVLDLPGDRPRPAVPSFLGAGWLGLLPPELVAPVRALARRSGASLFMALLAAWQVFLARHSGQDDFVVGTPVAGRDRAEVEGLIGLFVNTLALRARVEAEEGFTALLARVREATLGAFAHAGVPFERVVEAVQPRRSLGHSPLFQTMLSLQSAPVPAFSLPGLALSQVDVPIRTAPFDLTLAVAEAEGGLSAAWIWALDLFDAPTVARFAGRFETLLAAAAAEPERPVADLPLLTAAERQAVLQDWQGAEIVLPEEPCVHRVFAERLARWPEAVAAEYGGASLTYAGLDRRARRLARRLRDLGVGPDVRVGLCAGRSLDLLVGMLATLQAGGAYLPLDPDYPRERLAFLLKDAAPAAVLAQGHLADRLPEVGVTIIRLEEEDGAPEPFEPPAVSGGNLACVFYTSGSTGRPKGVAVTHRGVCRIALDPNWQIGPDDRMAQVSSPSFDAATPEIWGALLHGARLVGLRREEILAPSELAAAIRRHGLTVQLLTSAWFHRVAAERPDAFAPLASLIIGGEAGEPRAFAAVLAAGPPRRLIHAYGPTEVTTLTATATIRAVAPGAAILPVGLPVANTRVAVLDAQMRLLPPGVPGELFAGGDGVARGYLGRPDLTAERFVPDPFGPPGERLYATGDLARVLPGGDLEILGRRDLQVKIRGFRIELAEIEAALGEHPGVAQAVVIVQENSGDRRLIGFVVPRHPVDPAELRDLLTAKLPAFMVPAAIIVRPDLPLTSNGKLDRAALARLSPEARTGAGGEAPRTAAEELLATLWTGLLGVERPGPRDDFFALGGHSLLGTQLVARVREVFGVELPVRAIFEEPTLGALAAHIEALQRSGAPAAPPIRRSRSGEGPPPLTSAQQRLWFLDRLGRGREAYNIPTALRIGGPLDSNALESAIWQIQLRHEALRTTFAEREGEPMAVVATEPLGALARLDLHPDELRPWLAVEAARPFDLERGPVLRATLLRLAPEEHVLALTLHHVVADGWSVGVLVREMTELYTAAREGRPANLPELPIQLGDYARWQREHLSGETLAAQVALRRERLDGAPLALDLPVDRPWPAEPSGRGGLNTFLLPPDLSASLYALARRESVTPFMLLLTGFAALLARWCGQDDLLIGAPIAGRDRRETEGLVGLLANTLVLRADLRGEPALREALGRIREMALETFALADFPFERLVEELQPERSLARPPLVQATFALQNLPPAAVDLPGLAVESLATESGAVKMELSLALVEREEGFAGTFEHAVDLFEASTAGRMAAGFETLLAGMAAAGPGVPLLDLEILSEAERRQLLVEWSAAEDRVSEAGLHELFERQAERAPEAPAVIFEDERWTYARLLERSREIAGRLREQGIGVGDRVAITEGRSAERVARVLGVWMAGAAFVAVDAEQPEARRAEILQDGGFRVASLACIVYTSGSTGKPKGILAHHQGAATHLEWLVRNYGLGPSDVTLQLAPLTFDASLRDTLAPLAAGACLVIVPDEAARDPRALLERMAAHRITCLPSIVPSLLRPLAEEAAASGQSVPSLRLILASGETLHGADAAAVRRAFGSRVLLVNQYGPTEAALTSTWYSVEPDDEALPALPVGRPAASARVFLLDRALRPVPHGAVGEVCLGGPGLAFGYLGQPGPTAEAFVPDPFGTPGGRLYRTGDRGRFRPDGLLELRGRIDRQVKIRGQRVEPGEVEAVLRSHPDVLDAVVEARGDALAAWIVSPSPGGVRDFLAERLPAPFLPSLWTFLDALPLTAHGKVDRARLPEPGRERSTASEPPRDRTELQLVRLWEEILGVRPVGATDNFFELGGHSLAAVRLIAGLRRLTGRTLPLSELFRRPTIRSLAQALSEEQGSRSPLVPLAVGGTDATPLFCVHGAGGNVLVFASLARALGDERPVHALEACGLAEGETPLDRIEDMADLYLAAIREVRPHGPYRLLGYSMGSKIAFEMARRLEAADETVEHLTLVDIPAVVPEGTEEPLDPEVPDLPDLDPEAVQRHLAVWRANREASRRWQPKPYGGSALLVVAEEGIGAAAEDPTLGWGEVVAGGVEVVRAPGDHYTVLARPESESRREWVGW